MKETIADVVGAAISPAGSRPAGAIGGPGASERPKRTTSAPEAFLKEGKVSPALQGQEKTHSEDVHSLHELPARPRNEQGSERRDSKLARQIASELVLLGKAKASEKLGSSGQTISHSDQFAFQVEALKKRENEKFRQAKENIRLHLLGEKMIRNVLESRPEAIWAKKQREWLRWSALWKRLDPYYEEPVVSNQTDKRKGLFATVLEVLLLTLDVFFTKRSENHLRMVTDDARVELQA